MRKVSLLWQIFIPYLLIILSAILVVTWYASRTLKRFYLETAAANLEVEARLITDQIPHPWNLDNQEAVTQLCKRIAGKASIRLTVILPNGAVLGDSNEDPARMDNHSNRPEIKQALRGEIGQSIRFSHTVKMEMMYVALPILVDHQVQGIVRSSIPLTEISQALSLMYRRISLGALLMACVAAFASWVLSKRISGPLQVLRRGVLQIAHGDFNERLPIPATLEMADLAEAANHMAEELKERIDAVTRQHSQLDAMLSSMVEGVVALDTEQRLLSLNSAAAELLNIDPDTATGRSLSDLTQNVNLLRLTDEASTQVGTVNEDIPFDTGTGTKMLHASGTQLFDSESNAIGVLIVLNDVTEVRNLEDMRREFVANVSHEIRTPITSIKGFLETLLDGALEEPEDSKRFLRIISRQAERLEAIIEDILMLSRLDQVKRAREFELSETRLKELLQSAIEVCEPKAMEKAITVHLSCPDEVLLVCNSNLLEQAVINLIDNAIKYSEPEKSVQVEVKVLEKTLTLSVRDQGCGISEEHFARLFERFYRVDKARSRTMGGTGLGLAIVKHIVKFHNGVVRIQSELGQGSCFTIEIPLDSGDSSIQGKGMETLEGNEREDISKRSDSLSRMPISDRPAKPKSL